MLSPTLTVNIIVLESTPRVRSGTPNCRIQVEFFRFRVIFKLANFSRSTEFDMSNVFVEPVPKGKPEGSSIDGYVLELSGHKKLVDDIFKTQTEAIAYAKQKGYSPLVARVRNTDKGTPGHWRAA
jgi:hypothetical protein